MTDNSGILVVDNVAYAEGWNAYYFSGADRRSNPYERGTGKSEEWDRGWLACEQEYGE
jgi:hypothetical protein